MMLVISPSLVLKHITVNVRDKGVGVGGGGVHAYNIMMNGRSVCICIDCDFSLGVNSQRWPHMNNTTHIKGNEVPEEI